MKSKIFFVLILLGLLTFNAISETGNVDWINQYVTAIGLGAYPDNARSQSQKIIQARTAAIVLAQRDLLGTLKGLHITSNTTIEDALVANDTVKRTIEGKIRYAKILSETSKEYGYEVIVGIHLKDIRKALFENEEVKNKISNDQYSSAVKKINIPEISYSNTGYYGSLSSNEETTFNSTYKESNNSNNSSINNISEVNYSEKTEFNFSDTKMQEKETEIKIAKDHMDPSKLDNYTCLVIDAKGLSLEPSMAPLLFNDKNEIVYGRVDVNADYVIENGIVRYINDISDLSKLTDVGDKPLKIRAIGIKDNFSPVIKYSDSRIVLAADKKTGILKNFKVIFIK